MAFAEDMTPGMALRNIEQMFSELDLPPGYQAEIDADLKVLWDHVLLGRY